jgi:hypothetical protein
MFEVFFPLTNLSVNPFSLSASSIVQVILVDVSFPISYHVIEYDSVICNCHLTINKQIRCITPPLVLFLDSCLAWIQLLVQNVKQ